MLQPDRHYADDGSVTLIFRSPIECLAQHAAEAWLRARGFRFGPPQRGCPRGVFHGDAPVKKWKLMVPLERAGLDGTMTGDGRGGPVKIWIRHDAPREAREAIVAGVPPAPPMSRDRVAGHAIEAALALALVAGLSSVAYVGLHPIFAPPRHPDIGKIELRVPGQGGTREARR